MSDCGFSMETRHTPGPWHVNQCRVGYTIHADCDPWVVVRSEDDEGRHGVIEKEADAMLIAKAPIMLAALEEAESVLRRVGCDVTADKMRAVIVEATEQRTNEDESKR